MLYRPTATLSQSFGGASNMQPASSSKTSTSCRYRTGQRHRMAATLGFEKSRMPIPWSYLLMMYRIAARCRLHCMADPGRTSACGPTSTVGPGPFSTCLVSHFRSGLQPKLSRHPTTNFEQRPVSGYLEPHPPPPLSANGGGGGGMHPRLFFEGDHHGHGHHQVRSMPFN